MLTRLSSFFLVGLLLALSAAPARAAGLRDVIQALETPFQAATPGEQRIQDYTADFFQESRIASLDRQQRARGRVSVRFDYRRGGQVPTVMFNWQYDEPTTQEIISDGKTLWAYLPENNQVIQSDIEMVSKAREGDPLTFLTGLGNLSRDFMITYATPNRDIEGNYILDLRPRRTSALLNRMVIVVDRAVLDDKSANVGAAHPDPTVMEPPGRSLRSGDFRSPLPPPRTSSFFDDRPQSGGVIFPILATSVYDANGNSTTIEFSNLSVNRGLSTSIFTFILPAGVEVVRPTGKEMGF